MRFMEKWSEYALRASILVGMYATYPGVKLFANSMNLIDSTKLQINSVDAFIKSQIVYGERLQYCFVQEKSAA